MTNFISSRQEWIQEMVPARFRGFSWDNVRANSTAMSDKLNLLRNFADQLRKGEIRSLLLYGPPSSCKTMTAAIIWQWVAAVIEDRSVVNDAVAAGTADNIVWVNGADVPRITKGSATTDVECINIHHLQTAYLGVIDDMDKCPLGWGTALYNVIDQRLCHQSLPTIATMNATPREFVAKYGEYGLPMFDRFRRVGALVIRMNGEH